MKIFKVLYQRYKDMGNLLWVVCILLLSIIVYYTLPVIDLIQAGGDERMLGWAYVCNLLALVILCVNILRLDWSAILLFGFLLQFVGKIVRRAVKLKEEQDLTI